MKTAVKSLLCLVMIIMTSLFVRVATTDFTLDSSVSVLSEQKINTADHGWFDGMSDSSLERYTGNGANLLRRLNPTNASGFSCWGSSAHTEDYSTKNLAAHCSWNIDQASHLSHIYAPQSHYYIYALRRIRV